MYRGYRKDRSRRIRIYAWFLHYTLMYEYSVDLMGISPNVWARGPMADWPTHGIILGRSAFRRGSGHGNSDDNIYVVRVRLFAHFCLGLRIRALSPEDRVKLPAQIPLSLLRYFSNTSSLSYCGCTTTHFWLMVSPGGRWCRWWEFNLLPLGLIIII